MLFGLIKGLFNEIASPKRRPAVAERAIEVPSGASGMAMSEREAICQSVLDLMPNSAEAHNNLGDVLRDAGRLVEAEEAFRHAIALQGDHAAALCSLGIVLAETNRPEEAEAFLRSAVKSQPDLANAHVHLGAIFRDTARMADAESSFRRALELNSDLTEAQQGLNIVAERIKRLAEVEANCRRTLESTPGSVDAHIDLGVFLNSVNRRAEAEVSFQSAVELDPNNVAAIYNLGVVLAQRRCPWEAAEAFRKAIDLQPQFVDAFYNLGVVLAETHRHREAEDALRRAIELQPDHAEAHNNLGILLKETMRLPEAEVAFRRVLTLKPGHEGAHGNLDLVLREIEHLSKVRAAGQRAVELSPDGAAPHYKLALTLMALGNLDDAIAGFRRALAIDPRHADAHNSLGTALMRRKRLEDAISCYLQAISTRPDFAKAMTNLGAAYIEKKDFAQAARWSQAALAIEPHQFDANRNLALILLATGHRDEARQYLDRASGGQSVYVEYAANPARSVLLLCTGKVGNVPAIDFLFPATINTRIKWVIESDLNDQTDRLPPYDLVFNAMGDPDLAGDSVGPVARFAESCATPLLNHPRKVARTARHRLPALLDGIDNIIVPDVWRFTDATDWDDSIVDRLPLLIRPVESHGGIGLERVASASELARCRELQSGPVYVTRFVDFRSADSLFRKYRMIFVDRDPYPLHLAISQNWVVHYYTAEMETCPWKLEEEMTFLQHPETALGTIGMGAIRSIGARIDLEYAGIDFSVMADGRILVFEANPTMLIHPEEIAGPLEHKNEFVFRIQDQFEKMLKRFCP